jgi:hypothetical protein
METYKETIDEDEASFITSTRVGKVSPKLVTWERLDDENYSVKTKHYTSDDDETSARFYKDNMVGFVEEFRSVGIDHFVVSSDRLGIDGDKKKVLVFGVTNVKRLYDQSDMISDMGYTYHGQPETMYKSYQ